MPAPTRGSAASPRRWRRWAAEAALVLAIVLGVQAWQARDVPGGPAPDFAARLADGQAMTLAQWRAAHAGRPVAVYFWAEWCAICKAQQGNVAALMADWPVLTVAMQSGDATKVALALAARGLAWPTAIDADGDIARRFGLHGVPALVVLDADGNIDAVAIGYTTEVGMRARMRWAARGG